MIEKKVLQRSKTPRSPLKFFTNTFHKLSRENIGKTGLGLMSFVTFTFLLILVVSSKIISKIYNHLPRVFKNKKLDSLASIYKKLTRILDKKREGSISRSTLIELSIRNMNAKKTRTIITIFGMAVGIGAIVFLVSIGYGLQQLVISRVARLDEMRQADVHAQPGSNVKINDKSISDIQKTQNIKMVLPLIAVVGRVSFQNSVSDMAVYGVTSDYLKQSAIQPVQGHIFDSNKLVVSVNSPKNDDQGKVAGISTEAGKEQSSGIKSGDKIQDIEFSLTPNAWVRVREKPSSNAKILGYTKRTEGVQTGEEVWGGTYESDDGSGESGNDKDGKPLGKWIKAPLLLWEQKECETDESDCINGSYMLLRDGDKKQVQKEAYFAELNVSFTGVGVKNGQVLGITSETGDNNEPTSSAEADINSAGDEFVEIASESAAVKPVESKQVQLGKEAKRETIVNRAMLKVLGIAEEQAIGKKFGASFIATGDLLQNNDEKIESVPTEYTIVGVIPGEKTPIFYVPFIDLRSIGIVNYSQMKIVVNTKEDLQNARRQIEALGYTTSSVADTVTQINSLFTTARSVLILLGMVALGVAALGMFNTLTVSLLERTREVGLMKAMGMKSSEVRELFLTESMIMGFFGGSIGLVLGFAGGKLLGLFLSLFAVFKGGGIIDISYIPPLFTITILVLSLLIGLTTGIYPAKRATKISALDALRYE